MSAVGIDSYTLRMIEQMSAPLRKIEQQMERTSRGMASLQKLALAAFSGGAVILGIKTMSSAIGGLISVMGAGVGIAKSFMGAVMEATKFRQQNLTALNVLLGKGAGEQAYKGALRVGGLTSASESEVVEQVRKLAGAGYSGGGLNRVNAALLDVQALGGNESMQSLAYYFQKFKGGLSVERDDVRMAAATAGIKERDLLSSALGVAGVSTSGLSDVQLGKAVEQAKKSGKLTGETMVEALLQSIKGKLDEGGPLGSFALKMGSKTLAGLMSNLEEAPTRFLKEMKLEEMPGITSLMEFIKRILVFFDHGTAQGQQLARVVEQITDALFGGLDKVSSDDLGKFFAAGLRVAQLFVKVIKEAWGLIDRIAHSDDPWRAAGDALAAALIEVGRLIGLGIIRGVKGIIPPSIATTDSAADAAAREESAKNFGGVQQGLFLRETLTNKGGVSIPGLRPTTVNMGGVTVNGSLSPEQARDTAHNLTEAIRNSNGRGGVPQAPQAATP